MEVAVRHNVSTYRGDKYTRASGQPPVVQMTGAQARERVPGWVVRKANQVEPVDSSPEQIRRRMLHGNIFPAAKVPQALTHFFRTNNLIAMRELALRFLADETEEDLLDLFRRPQAQGL